MVLVVLLLWRREGDSPTRRGGSRSVLRVFRSRPPLVGAVGMWESRPPSGGISKGLWELVESLPSAFHSFHQPRHFHSSECSFHPAASYSRGAVGDSCFTWRNSFAFSWRIFRAASVSLICPARRSRLSKPIPGLRNFCASGNDFSFS